MADKRKIIFRGAQVTEDWPERLRDAQTMTHCAPNGITMERVRYGDEKDDWGANTRPCHDCSAIKGEFHFWGCDVEQCPACGGQAIGCDCHYPGDEEDTE